MKKTTMLAALFLALLVAAAGAQPQPSATAKKTETPAPVPQPETKPDPKFEKLVEQLGDTDFRKRDLAATQLKSAGVKALPVLRAALKHPDAEVRRRLVELIPSIETAALLEPKRITIKMKDKPIKDIFDEMIKQTGYKYDYFHNDPNAKFTLDLDNVTYWEAIDKITRATGLSLQQGWGDDHVRFNYTGETGPGAPHIFTEGGFRFTAMSFNLYKTVDLSQSGRNASRRTESLTLTFSIQSEPKLPILGVGEARLSSAFDSEKNSMLLPSTTNEENEWGGPGGRRYVSRYGNGNRMWYQQTQFTLNRVTEKAATLKSVKGVLPITLLAEQKPHVIAAKILDAKGKKETIGSTTLIVDEVKEIPNTPQVSVKVTFNEDTGGNPNDYSWQNSIYQRLEVQDSKGEKYQIYGSNWGHSNGTSMQMTLTFGPMDQTKKPIGDLKLVFQEWKVMQHQVNFEFKDVPLP